MQFFRDGVGDGQVSLVLSSGVSDSDGKVDVQILRHGQGIAVFKSGEPSPFIPPVADDSAGAEFEVVGYDSRVQTYVMAGKAACVSDAAGALPASEILAYAYVRGERPPEEPASVSPPSVQDVAPYAPAFTEPRFHTDVGQERQIVKRVGPELQVEVLHFLLPWCGVMWRDYPAVVPVYGAICHIGRFFAFSDNYCRRQFFRVCMECGYRDCRQAHSYSYFQIPFHFFGLHCKGAGLPPTRRCTTESFSWPVTGNFVV